MIKMGEMFEDRFDVERLLEFQIFKHITKRKVCNVLSRNQWYVCDVVVRFKREEYEVEFYELGQMLETIGWVSVNQTGSSDQIDLETLLLVHRDIEDPRDNRFSFIPSKPREAYFKSILLPAVLDKTNMEIPKSYALIESNFDVKLIPIKLSKIEKALTFFLIQKRTELKTETVNIDQVVRFVGIASTDDVESEIQRVLEQFKCQLPYLNSLKSMGRLFWFIMDCDLSHRLREHYEMFDGIKQLFTTIQTRVRYSNYSRGSTDRYLFDFGLGVSQKRLRSAKSRYAKMTEGIPGLLNDENLQAFEESIQEEKRYLRDTTTREKEGAIVGRQLFLSEDKDSITKGVMFDLDRDKNLKNRKRKERRKKRKVSKLKILESDIKFQRSKSDQGFFTLFFSWVKVPVSFIARIFIHSFSF
jgi:hypothetical protein